MGPLGFAFLAKTLKAAFKGCTPTKMRDMDASWDCAGLYAFCAQKPVASHGIVRAGTSGHNRGRRQTLISLYVALVPQEG